MMVRAYFVTISLFPIANLSTHCHVFSGTSASGARSNRYTDWVHREKHRRLVKLLPPHGHESKATNERRHGNLATVQSHTLGN